MTKDEINNWLISKADGDAAFNVLSNSVLAILTRSTENMTAERAQEVANKLENGWRLQCTLSTPPLSLILCLTNGDEADVLVQAQSTNDMTVN